MKKIKVSLGASPTALPAVWNNITFAAIRTTAEDLLNDEEWGNGQKAYIWITVQDSGCGLTPAEQGKLFARFSQATPRTHVQYGGSGLGLFISKSLTELHGGCIGVHSEADVGSTFAFFIATRIVLPTKAERGKSSTIRPGIGSSTSIEKIFKAEQYNVLIVEDNLVNVSGPMVFITSDVRC